MGMHVRVKFNQIAMKNNRLQPFFGLSAISRPFHVFDIALRTYVYVMGSTFPPPTSPYAYYPVICLAY
jgi:hypothetical protein